MQHPSNHVGTRPLCTASLPRTLWSSPAAGALGSHTVAVQAGSCRGALQQWQPARAAVLAGSSVHGAFFVLAIAVVRQCCGVRYTRWLRVHRERLLRVRATATATVIQRQPDDGKGRILRLPSLVAQPTSLELDRRELATSLALVAAAVGTGASALLPSAHAEVTQGSQKMSMTKGENAEELVYLGWFAGVWGCSAQLLKAEAGPEGSEAKLEEVVPGSKTALQAAMSSIGTDKAVKRARCTWKPTSPDTNGMSPGFAVEEAGGICAGVVAAAALLCGPDAKAVPQPLADSATWEVTGLGTGKLLIAAGAVGKPDVDGEGSFRVSELFDVEDKASRGKVLAVVRVSTVYKKAVTSAAATGPDKSAKPKQANYIFEGLQRATLLPAPKTPGGDPGQKGLVTYTSLLLYRPLKA